VKDIGFIIFFLWGKARGTSPLTPLLKSGEWNFFIVRGVKDLGVGYFTNKLEDSRMGGTRQPLYKKGIDLNYRF